jgi:hypothetical protein
MPAPRENPTPTTGSFSAVSTNDMGEAEAAEAAYRKSIGRKESLPALDSAALLAQRRLDGLQKTK